MSLSTNTFKKLRSRTHNIKLETQSMKLSKVVEVIEEKCVNCHQCISACPVKFANNGSGETVHINHDLCIGCGSCIHACTHQARVGVDDFDRAMEALTVKREKMVAVVAPAVGSNFPGTFLRLNGWLKTLGVSAVFDVSFGAELTVKSYLEHVGANKPKTVIAQPCPAIVSYIQIYRPSLLQFLAPADSPMVHTMKMIRRFYPQYADHRLMVVSPCIAKRREFDETGFGDYNVTITSIVKYLEKTQLSLMNYPEANYDNDPAERAVLFSTPGGLLETAERELPGIRHKTRKIEGVHTIYHYLDHLEESISQGTQPLLIDCLNCELGCNGGTGTQNHKKTQDELEHNVRLRKEALQKQFGTETDNNKAVENLRKTIDKYWEKDLYNRSYKNHSDNHREQVKSLSDSQMQETLLSMAKFKEEDLKNCASCGYNACHEMAKAIFNGYNRKENCHFYLDHKIKEMNRDLDNKVNERTAELIRNSEELLLAMDKIKQLIAQ